MKIDDPVWVVRGAEWIVKTSTYSSFESPLCTIQQGGEAYLHMKKGPAICKARGDHDFSDKVPQTSNMYLCFRCGEPGWVVPYVDA